MQRRSRRRANRRQPHRELSATNAPAAAFASGTATGARVIATGYAAVPAASGISATSVWTFHAPGGESLTIRAPPANGGGRATSVT